MTLSVGKRKVRLAQQDFEQCWRVIGERLHYVRIVNRTPQYICAE